MRCVGEGFGVASTDAAVASPASPMSEMRIVRRMLGPFRMAVGSPGVIASEAASRGLVKSRLGAGYVDWLPRAGHDGGVG
jgi:hypothetical protein